jgi:hypothetical protein
MAVWQRIFRQAAVGVSRYRVRRFSSPGVHEGKRAALVYLVPSALNGAFLGHHPNLAEVGALRDELQSRGFAIDAYDYRSRRSVGGYNLVLGFGDAVYRAQRAGAGNVVLYATGASANFQHRSVEAVLGQLSEEFGPDAVKYVRIPERYLGISEAMSGHILSIGNAWTASTFARPERVASLPGIVSGVSIAASDVIAGAATRGPGLAWIGSKGILHKGLHVAAAVARRLGVHLHALGIKEDETAFAKMVLERSGCRHTIYPFVTPGEAIWMRVVRECRAVVGASLSEGMSTALLTAARTGLYPVSTQTCGISVGDVVAPDGDAVGRLAGGVEKVLAAQADAYGGMVGEAVMRVAADNTIDAYRSALTRALDSMGVGR